MAYTPSAVTKQTDLAQNFQKTIPAPLATARGKEAGEADTHPQAM